jgi:hypothetical protein
VPEIPVKRVSMSKSRIGKLFGWFDGIGKLKASYTIRDGGKEF